MDFSRFDLNLLKTLHVLERERSVQLAATRLNLTPSAVSHALARLRRDMQDVLFIRSGSRLVPTERCRAALVQIRPLLLSVEAILRPVAIGDEAAATPQSMPRELRMAMPGAVEVSLVPPLVERLRAEAPGWTVSVQSFERRSYAEDLITGTADIVLSVGGHTPPGEGLSISTLWQDELVLVRRPRAQSETRSAITLEALAALPQVYAHSWPTAHHYLDTVLARRGLHRNICLKTSGYAAVASTLLVTDLVCVMPEHAARTLRGLHAELQIVRIEPRLEAALALETSTAFAATDAGRWALALLRHVATEVDGAGR